MANIKIALEDEFKEWFATSAKHPQSPSDYLSGMRTIYAHVAPRIKFDINQKTYDGRILLEAIPHLIGKNKESKKVAVLLLTRLLLEIESLPDKTCPNQSNLSSHLRKYREFVICRILSSEQKTVNAPEGLPKITQAIAKELIKQFPIMDEVYRHDELLTIFKQRFITQDRKAGTYAHELHMRKISSKLKNLGFIDWAYDFLLNNVKFIIDSDGKTVLLKEVESLTIEKDGGVKVKLRGSKLQFDVYTEIYKASQPKKFKDCPKCDISDLALDHDEPIYNVLATIGQVPNLDTIDTTTNLQGLFDEVKMIHKKVSFTIMDQTENVKKGKKS